MGHYHGHHHHNHADVGRMSRRKLLWVTLLNLLITVVQIIGGIISNSLSLLSDALHNLGDSSAIFIAFVASRLSLNEANSHKTFGYKRFEILAAFFNALVLIGICIYLLFEVYDRIVNPEPIHGRLMFFVAIVGLLANLISVLILQKEKDENLNIKAAYLHLMGDTLSSVAVILGGFFIWRFNILWLDPVITILVSLYIIGHTWGVLKESADILMQGTPPGVCVNEIKKDLEQIDKIKNIHHVHVWRLNDKDCHFEGHVLLTEDMRISQLDKIRILIEKRLKTHFNISHVTLQVEYDSCNDTTLIKRKE